MSDSTILIRRDEAVVTVTLNRPEKRNALDLATWHRLGDTMEEVANQQDIRCVVLQGAGSHFAGGADISAFATERATPDQVRSYAEAEHRGVMGVYRCPHPTVASVAGACAGGGLEIALACDVRVAGASARFGAPINRLGLTMSYEELRLFIQRVGSTVALELLLEGTMVDAHRAREVGIVNRVVPDSELADHTSATVKRIVDGAPLVNRWHKKFVRRLTDPASLTDSELAEGYAAFETRDYQIGYRAFLEKHKPEFRGE